MAEETPMPDEPFPWRRFLWAVPAAALAVILLATYILALPVSVERAKTSPCKLLGISNTKSPAWIGRTQLPDLQGNVYQLSSFRGRTTLINLWLTTCEPCLEEIPSLFDLVSRYQHRGLALLMIATDKKRDTVKKFLERIPRLKHHPKNTLVLHDPDGRIFGKRLGTTKYPETYIMNPATRLTGRIVGARNWSRRAIAACIAEQLP